MLKNLFFNFIDNFQIVQNYIEVDVVLLLCSVVMVLIMFVIPSYWRPIIKIYSDNIKLTFKLFFWFLSIGLVIFNVFLYFSQPNFQNETIGVERQSKDVTIRTLESDKAITMTRHLYDFLEKRPDDRFYTYTTVWMWKNIFMINNIAVSLIIIYSFLVYIFFRIKFI